MEGNESFSELESDLIKASGIITPSQKGSGHGSGTL